MVHFFKDWLHFFKKRKPSQTKDLNIDNGLLFDVKEELLFSRGESPTKKQKKGPGADVHKLMIKATQIRKTKGYSEAIDFLSELADHYINDKNTALVVCMNKLIPYMKKDPAYEPDEIKKYLESIISRTPKSDPYFLNLHITMAQFIRSYDLEKSIIYLIDCLEKYKVNLNTFNIQICLANFLGEANKIAKSKSVLKQAKSLLSEKIERFELIKLERKWYRSSAKLNLMKPGEMGMIKYLNHRFIEFALDMARVLDPMHIEVFHERKDLYYKNERGFVNSEDFKSAIQELGLQNEQEALIKNIYGFCFEELPGIIGVTERQLHYLPGDLESIEELREKKMYHRKPFRELPEIEKRIDKIIKKYVR